MRAPTTRDEWLAETRPGLLIAALQDRVDDARLRRLACTFAREAWRWLADPRSRDAVEAAARHARGEASDDELAAAERAATEVLGSGGIAFLGAPHAIREERVAWYAARCAANSATTRPSTSVTKSAAWFAAQLACEALAAAMFEDAGVTRADDPRWSIHRQNDARLCALIREHFPDPPLAGPPSGS